MFRRILPIIGYAALTTLVVGITVLLVAYGDGYSYNFKKHQITRNGLVIINSVPNGLTVMLGDKSKKKTPYHASYEAGQYTFSINKDGFWPWQKTLNVVAGEVTLAEYVIMVPKTLTASVLDTKPQIVAQSVSKDHRHVAYVTGGDGAAVYTLDLGNPKPVKLYTPKAAADPVPAEVLNGVLWSDDASHLLISSTVGDQKVLQLAAASGGTPVNLTAQYRFDFTGLTFASGNWRQMYWISPDGLRRLDVDSQSVSAVLADKVSQFWIEPDRVLYVQQTDLGRSLWSLDSRGHHQQLIQALAESDSYSVALSTYQGVEELAVVPAKTQTGTLYTGIFGNNPVAKTIAHGVTSASFSPDGHLLAFSSGSSMVVYDLELSLVDSKFVAYNVADQPGQLTSLAWFDDFHLLTVRDGQLYFSEFDGANRVPLGSVVGGLPAFATSDSKSVVTYRQDAKGVRIEQVQLKQ